MTITPICGRFGCGNALNQTHRYRAVDYCSFACVEVQRHSDGYYTLCDGVSEPEGWEYQAHTGCLSFRRRVVR